MNADGVNDGAEIYKRLAGEHAAQLVQSGMIVGLGTGSTAIFATRHIAALLRRGERRDIIGFATSRAVWREAVSLGIPMLSEDLPVPIDLTIDGADEVDPALNLIKGGGGALLREKIVAQASAREIIVVDEGKLSPLLGTLHALPIEVLPYGWQSQRRFLEALKAEIVVRRAADGSEFRTDQGNMILDCRFGPIADAGELARVLGERAGILEHGLFIGLADDVIVAGKNGIRHLRRAGQEVRISASR